MSGSELEKLHAKIDKLLEGQADLNIRLSNIEVLNDAKEGRCDSHAASIQQLNTTVKGNGKPGLVTMIAELSGRVDTLSGVMTEKFKGLAREVTIYSAIGGAISAALMTTAVAVAAAKLTGDTRYNLKTSEPAVQQFEYIGGHYGRRNTKEVEPGK